MVLTKKTKSEYLFIYRGVRCIISKTKSLLPIFHGYVMIPEDQKVNIENLKVHQGVDFVRERNGWRMIGFHTGHMCDLDYKIPGARFKSVDYVVRELRNLVKQIV